MGTGCRVLAQRFSQESLTTLGKKTAQAGVACHHYLGLPVLAKVIKQRHSGSPQAGSGAVEAKENGGILRPDLSSATQRHPWS